MDNLDEKTLSQYSKIDDDGRRYQLDNITSAFQKEIHPNNYELMGVTRTWRWDEETMRQEVKAGRVVQTAPGNVPRFKRYLDEQRGKPLDNVWTDIGNLRKSDVNENTGYPTQKPVALLERIIAASTNVGDIVLDPFCGCATACVAAERLGRKWIGIDINKKAIDIGYERLNNESA